MQEPHPLDTRPWVRSVVIPATRLWQTKCNGTVDHEALNDEDINDIVIQLRKHPAIQQILSPIVREEDFKSSFKCVPENNASSYSE
jgi:hypothetical protein